MLPILLLSMIGFPLPIAPRKLVSERFPCENSPCGCSTATHCWDKCCCNNDEQKLAWAEQNNVPPPEFLVQRVAAKKQAAIVDASVDGSVESKPPCNCGKQSPVSKDKVVATKTKAASAQAKTKAATDPDSPTCDDPENEQESAGVVNRFKVVFLHSALECNGIQIAILYFSHCVFTKRVDAHFFDAPRIIAWLTLCDDSAESYHTCPDGPVPWLFTDA